MPLIFSAIELFVLNFPEHQLSIPSCFVLKITFENNNIATFTK